MPRLPLLTAQIGIFRVKIPDTRFCQVLRQMAQGIDTCEFDVIQLNVTSFYVMDTFNEFDQPAHRVHLHIAMSSLLRKLL